MKIGCIYLLEFLTADYIYLFKIYLDFPFYWLKDTFLKHYSNILAGIITLILSVTFKRLDFLKLLPPYNKQRTRHLLSNLTH